jgi:signal transduction histidine kinase
VSRLPLRVQLVAGFVVAMLVLLTAAGAFVYWRVEYALDRGLDTELTQATAVITPLVDATGHVTSPKSADATGAGWQVLDDTGQVVDSGGTAPITPLLTETDLDQVGTVALTKDIGRLLPITAKPYRVQVTALDQPAGHYLVVGVRRDHRDEALRELLLQLTLAGLGALVVGAVVGDALARAALRPVERYRRRAEEIAGGAGGLRLDVPEGRDDEVTRLGHTLNDMLAALERSLEHERRFVNDASHELRTPLTLLKGRIQLARRRTRSAAEYEAVLDELSIDVARLSALAEELLALGAADTTTGQADVTRIVTTIVERRRLAGTEPENGGQATVEVPARPVHAAIDPRPLERIVGNLIDNAFLHGAPPVEIRVRTVETAVATAEPGWTIIEVSDSGPGMSPDLLADATERFTRSDEARTRPGAGLGLSIVDQIIHHARGELRLCFDGIHASHGRPTPAVPCNHATAMTATMILPQPGAPATVQHDPG